MPMLTRKATTQEMEFKLTTALSELKASKLQCQQLLQEREESEEEVKTIIHKNSSLKRELVVLHQQHLDVIGERDKLQAVTDGFTGCSILYEEALSKVRDLEDELFHANSKVVKLQKDLECYQANSTDQLYNELLSADSCKKFERSLITIDLTEQDSSICQSALKHQKIISNLSHNKIKKYLKLSKLVKKCNNLKKQQKNFSKTNVLRKERVLLNKQLNNCLIKLEDSKNIYEIDTQRLESEIKSLEDNLHSLFNKYTTSQKQIEHHILAASELVDLCTYNADRVESLTLSNSQCTCMRESKSNESLSTASGVAPQLGEVEPSTYSTSCNSEDCHQTVMFSDSIGKGFGELLNNSLGHSVQNYCMPGANYKQIMTSVFSHKFKPHTILTLFIGSSLYVTKKHLTDTVAQLLNLECQKVILCAFPYFNRLTQSENKYIHMLNNQLQFLSSHYSDKLVFFDTNRFVNSLTVARDSVYLPTKRRHHIASLLVFNINSVINSMTQPLFNTNIFNVSCSIVRSLSSFNSSFYTKEDSSSITSMDTSGSNQEQTQLCGQMHDDILLGRGDIAASIHLHLN